METQHTPAHILTTPEASYELYVIEMQEIICELMHEKGFESSDLAKLVKKKPSDIRALLDDSRKFDLRLAVYCLHKLGYRPSVQRTVSTFVLKM